ncbi:MAG TPA: hypothetical protein VJ809_14020 [Pirellulales bacterium]|nr:hypothetical protein [Pirellulales bacterium]
MSKTSTTFRKKAAKELRESRNGGTNKTKAQNFKRAAAYKALAESEEWLGGEKQRSRKRSKNDEHPPGAVTGDG